jgi:hypothetical protein
MSPGTKSEDIQAEDYLKIVIIGEQKSGKTWFAATGPKPILYYDWDNRKESLEGKSGLYVQSTPTLTMLDVERDLSVMKAEVAKAKQANRKPVLPATVVHDTVTFMRKGMEDELRRQNPNSKFFRGIKVGNSTTVYVGQGWDVVNGIQNYMQYLVDEYSCIGINQIFVFHERDEKDKAESTAEAPKYTGKFTVDPQYLVGFLSKFNEVYRITVDATRPGQVLYRTECRPTKDFNTSTTMMLDATEPPDIMGMIAKHKTARAKLLAQRT